MTELSENNLGWFHIAEVWNLYVEGDLTEVEVYAINVDEAADGDGYIVDHYDRGEDIITTLRLSADDILPVVREREPVSHPFSA